MQRAWGQHTGSVGLESPGKDTGEVEGGVNQEAPKQALPRPLAGRALPCPAPRCRAAPPCPALPRADQLPRTAPHALPDSCRTAARAAARAGPPRCRLRCSPHTASCQQLPAAGPLLPVRHPTLPPAAGPLQPAGRPLPRCPPPRRPASCRTAPPCRAAPRRSTLPSRAAPSCAALPTAAPCCRSACCRATHLLPCFTRAALRAQIRD
ncbi:unnamed protein product [Closterium sp. NIES-53]